MESEKVKEIKKGLECCSEPICKENCSYHSLGCMSDLSKDSLILINELESENEKKHKRIMELEQDLIHADEDVFFRECNVALREDKIKSEALKQFAERVKMEFYYEFDEIIPSIMSDKIDKILKELQGND